MTDGKLVITGAGGFIGRHTVAEGLARGHRVSAVVRRASDRWSGNDDVETVVADLSDPACVAALTASCEGARAVIHLASHMGGDADQQEQGAGIATGHVLDAIAACNEPPLLVLAGSMSVYGYGDLAPGATVDETTPLERQPHLRDAYCRGKLAQEARVRAAGRPAWILRPGAVFGPDRLWNGHLGVGAGPLVALIGGGATVPVSWVGHTAQALVLAAGTDPDGIEEINVIDDDLPDQRAYLRAHQASGWPKAVVPVPVALLRSIGAIAGAIPGLGQKLPGLFRHPVRAARIGAFRYDNTRLKTRLGWAPANSFQDAMTRAIAESGQ